jgi:hypothetical protein
MVAIGKALPAAKPRVPGRLAVKLHSERRQARKKIPIVIYRPPANDMARIPGAASPAPLSQRHHTPGAAGSRPPARS